VSRRFTDQFAPAYLTLASIIQGVALGALVQRVEATYADFDAVDWALTAITFLVILDVWHEYLMMVLAYVWIPTLVDSIVPFAFLAAELFMAHFVFHDLRHWLLAAGVCSLVGVGAAGAKVLQARTLMEENRELHRVLAPQNRVRGLLAVVLAVLTLAAWAFYDRLRLEESALVVALVVLSAVSVLIASSVPYLNRILLFAQEHRAA